MATNATISKAKYDATHTKGYYLKYNLVYDSDIIEKLDSMESKQGYIKQLIRNDITRTDSVPVSDTAMAMLKEEAVKISKSVPDLVNLIIDDWFVRNRQCVPKFREEHNKMKTYHIKSEYLDLWEGRDTPSNPDRIITEDDVRTLSEEWEKPISELLKQLIEI